MKILHTSDLHIGSALTSRFSPQKAEELRRELLSIFDTLISEATSRGADVFIIAGDLFDSKRVTESVKRRIFDSVIRACDITFIYTSGNHEGALLEGEELPKNFIPLFNEEWSYFSKDGVCFAARSNIGANMFDDLKLDKEETNIAVLHGELNNYSADAIPPARAAGHGLDYIALGHYHKYSQTQIDDRAVAVYSGAPLGRGFDEAFETGYVIIDTDKKPISHEFIPLSKRRFYEKSVNISGAYRTADIERLIEESCSEVRRADILRVTLLGTRPTDFKPDVYALCERFSKNFFHFEIKDSSRVEVDIDAIKYDKTLKGEFIRTVLSDTELSALEKEKIIDFSIRALMGERPDGE